MSRAFRVLAGRVQFRLSDAEHQLLLALIEGLDDQLRRPSDANPIVERLFPEAVSDDEALDRELRGMFRDELVGIRRRGLMALKAVLDRMAAHRGILRTTLDDEEPAVVLGVVNDLRLALGAQVTIEKIDRTKPIDDHTRLRLEVIDHLGALQEQLIEIVDPKATLFREEIGPDDLDRPGRLDD